MGISTQDKIAYWKKWVGIGSEWIIVAFEEEVITVVGIRYDDALNTVVVDFVGPVFPGFTESISADQFTDGRFVRKQ